MSATGSTQMFEHALDFLKGSFGEHQLDFTSKLSSSVSASALPVSGGRVVHLDPTGFFQLGAARADMPIFLFSSSDGLDVANPGNGQTKPYGWTAVMPSGDMIGLVATGGFELSSSEYDQTAGVAMLPGDLLHAPTEAQITVGTDKSMAGKLFKTKTWPGGGGGAVAFPGDNICGHVSRAAAPNHNRVNVVSFWTVYQIGTTN